MNKINLLVIFGGVSPEHNVSCLSAASVVRNIDTNKYNLDILGITKDGRWFITNASPEQMEDGSWEKMPDNKRAIVSPERCEGNLIIFSDEQVNKRIDVCFPVLHGENGEDGRMSGLFELAGIKYVGVNMRAGANCMDKLTTKIILNNAGINQADYVAVLMNDYKQHKEDLINKIEDKFGYPVFVKPSGTGSSVGVSKAKSREDLISSIENALQFDSRVLVEEFVKAREVEIAVLGNEAPIASVCGEIFSCNEFYDYEAKYQAQSITKIPADIDDNTYEKIRDTAIKAYIAMGCEGLSRIDFFVNDNTLILNEINTMPGFTSISMYSKMFAKSGIEYKDLVDKLIELAIER